MHDGAAGILVITVHILGDDHHLSVTFQVSQGLMGGIEPGFGNEAPPPVIPLPDQFGVSIEGLWSGQLFRSVLIPETVLFATERGDAAGC